MVSTAANSYHQDTFCWIYDLEKSAPSTKSPFPHQSEAIKRLSQWFKQNHEISGGILVLPTGGGKTFTTWRFLCNDVLSKGYKVLWLAHTHHLLEQAFYSLESEVGQIKVGQSANKKQLKVRVVSGTEGHFSPAEIASDDDVLICTLQTITRAYKNNHPRFQDFLKSTNGKLFVVFDEAHHSPAPSYCEFIQALQKSFSEMHLLGLTATPTHGSENKVGWLKELFPQKILYQASAEDLIASKVLAKPKFETVETQFTPEFDQQKYQRWVRDYRDLPEDIVTKLAENQERNEYIAKVYAENKDKYQKTIIFADRWFQCEYLCKALRNYGIRADTIYSHIGTNLQSTDPSIVRTINDNKVVIEKFKNGEIDVLVNIRILTEGTDIPSVKSVFLTRQTTSKILLTQMVGRALRGSAVGGKDEAHIVSFVDDWQHAIVWANWRLEDGGTTIVDGTSKTVLKEIISIDLVQKLIQQMDSGENVNPVAFLEYIPLGWYMVNFTTSGNQFEENSAATNFAKEDVEDVSRLVMLFQHEKESYENFIKHLKTHQNEASIFADPMTQFKEQSGVLDSWEKQFFSSIKHIGGNLAVNLYYLACHLAQNNYQAPQWFEFSERNNHDLDAIAKRHIKDRIDPQSIFAELKEEFCKQDRYWNVLYSNFLYFKSHYDACINRILNCNTSSEDNGSPPNVDPPPDIGLTSEERETILQRDKYRCLCCGNNTRKYLQVDHIIPQYYEKNHAPENLQTLCKTCHKLKSKQDSILYQAQLHFDFTKTATPLQKKPSSLLETSTNFSDYNSSGWKESLRRYINFFYKCSAVKTIDLNETKLIISLHPGNEPRWLQPYLWDLESKFRKQIGASRRIAITTPEMTVISTSTTFHEI